MKQNIDKLKQTIEDGLEVYQDIEKALSDDGKISLIEGSGLVLKHGGKAMRLIASIKEIGQEVVDLDGTESSELASLLIEQFGGDIEAEEAILDIAEGAGLLNSGIQKLIRLRNS